MSAAVGDAIEISGGPFAGVHDSSDPGASGPTRLFDLLNMVVPDPRNGSAVLARHGMQGQATQLGDTISRTGQCSLTHHRLDGTVDRWVFAGGKMYLWDGLTTYTDITPAGIAIDATNPIFACEFNGEVLFSDEKNKPWIYTPATGAAETIEIDTGEDEWTTKGGFVAYSGFPIAIVHMIGASTLITESSDTILTEDGRDLLTELLSGFQNTIAWGNAFDPRTGYDQADYDHLWELTQTSNELLGALFAEEGALVYFRNSGIGLLTGPVNENFRGSATRDAVSNTLGTDAPAGVIAKDKKIFFPDMDGRIHMMTVGAGPPVPLWFPIRRSVETNFGTEDNRANVVAYCRAAYHAQYNLILYTIWDRQTIYGFHADTGQFMGQWTVLGGVHIDAMGEMLDSASRSTFVFIGTRGTSYALAAQGIMWKQKHPDDSSQWLDQADASVAVHTAFERSMEPHYMGHAQARQFRANRVIVELLGASARHAVKLQYKTPGAALSDALTAQSTAVTGEKNTEDAVSRARWSLGRQAQGGTLRLKFSADHSDNVRFGVHNILIEGQITAVRAGAK